MDDPRGETYLARLTPPGKSAIATLSLFGPRAWEIMLKLFKPRNKKPLPVLPAPGSVFLGRLGLGHGDEVVVGCKTINPIHLEIHPHGGTQVVSMLLEFLQAEGATLCNWQDFITYITKDPLQSMALILLNQATTSEPSKVLLDQFNGAFRLWLDSFLLYIDQGDIKNARSLLSDISRYSHLSAKLIDPWRVVLAGPTNAGKSSLMNILAGYQRSIVSEVPGTTRDVLWLETAIEGWPVSFADTAGLRISSDPLENAGMLMGANATEQADLILWIQDCSVVEIPVPVLFHNKKIIEVSNKIDLDGSYASSRQKGEIRISALSGLGVDELLSKIIFELVSPIPKPCQAVAFHPLLKSALEKSVEFVDKGQLLEVSRLWASFLKNQN
ncbi:MAG: GTP-binding protein [Planctomycetes bacterium]|nr:GTP-binding protein [Planctomycetota bacterium]